jgi:hypothetical protein
MWPIVVLALMMDSPSYSYELGPYETLEECLQSGRDEQRRRARQSDDPVTFRCVRTWATDPSDGASK